MPRLYNKIFGKVDAKFAALTGCKKWLKNKGMASKLAGLKQNRSVYRSGCYDKLLFKKVAALLGGNLRYCVTGSAPIDAEVLETLKVCFCCPILEGYGLTETSAASTLSHEDDPVSGHVGGPIDCCKVRLRSVPEMNYRVEDKPYPRGEILMTGANVFEGYYKNEEKTKECFDEDGWFCSGDVGMIYPNGSIKIIDRVKNIFKLSQGEYIAPEKMENIFVKSKYVA